MKLILLPAVLCFFSSVSAQSISWQVIAPGGDYTSGPGGSLSATIAQPIAGLIGSSSVMLYQGFQFRPTGIEVITGLEEDIIKWKVYPNPVVQQLYIETDPSFQMSGYTLIDMTGKSVMSTNHLATSSASIELTSMTPGVYVLQLLDNNGRKKSITIIKSY